MLLGVTPSLGQTTIRGMVVDSDGMPVEVANVLLLEQADSTHVAGTLSDASGRFRLAAVKDGRYLVFVSLIGYEDATLEVSSDGSATIDLGKITLRPTMIEMGEVSVEARRVLFERKPDRLVVNVANSVVSAGRSALEVLERSPGILVNRQAGSISLVGKEGVNVMVDGRIRYVPPDGLIDFFSGIDADNIQSIELITTPPARVDAEGNAGFINIVLKESRGAGLNGNVSLSAGYGHGARGGGSGGLTYERGPLSIFATYSGTIGDDEVPADLDRRVLQRGVMLSSPTHTFRDELSTNNDLRLSIEVRASDRTTFGGVFAAYRHIWDMEAATRMSLRHDDTPVSHLLSDNNEIHNRHHAMGNLHVDRRIGKRSTLRADVDYVYYHDHNPTIYDNTTTRFTDENVTYEQFESDKRTPLGIAAATMDLETSLNDRLEVAAGLKTAGSRFTNETRYEGLEVEDWMVEAGISSTNILRENVHAAYGSLSIQPDSATTIRAGLRIELAETDLHSRAGQQFVDRRYGEIFPSIVLTRKLGARRSVNATYSRRITRPAFGDLALALYFFDPTTVLTGNPAVQPAIINSVGLDFTVGDVLMGIEYSVEDSTISRFQSQILTDEHIELIYAQNASTSRWLSGMLAFPLQPARWWTSQFNLTARWQEVSGYRLGDLVEHDRASLHLTSTQNFSLPYDTDLEVNGSYRSASLYGLMTYSSGWVVDASLRRSLHSGRGNLTLTLNNIFNSNSQAWYRDLHSSYVRWEFQFGRRNARLTYSLRFGDRRSAAQRSTATQEERRRMDG